MSIKSTLETNRLAAMEERYKDVEERTNQELSCDNHETPEVGCDACKIKILGLQGGNENANSN